MKRRYTCALALGAVLCGQRATAQGFLQRAWDITHTLHMPNLPIYGTNTVRGHFFDHVWAVYPFGQGVDSWQAAPPWTTPPTWPNTQQQPAGFDPYGTEWLWHYTPIPNSNHGPFTWPYNVCMPGYNLVQPCFQNPWPPPGNPLTAGFLLIPDTGTGPDWDVQVDLPTSPLTYARSEVEVQPFAAGWGLVDATIRSAGAHQYKWGGLWEQTYAFSWTNLTIGRNVRPQLHPPGIPINWGLLCSVNAGGPSTTVPAWWPPNAGYPIQSFYDPITFVLTDLASGATRSGELFQLVVELDQGWCDVNNGFLALDTQEGGLRVRMDHPFISPRGTLDIEIAGGQVVTSRATGYFASMVLPPVGTSSPLALNFPSNSFDFVFDATSEFPGDHDVTFYMGGAGGEERLHSIATGACCDNGVCTSGVTEGNCAAAGGTWQGAGSACPDAPYAVEEFRGGFEDIAVFGVPSLAGNCDNCGEVVPLGFTFNYHGVPHTNVGLASNGYLTFGGSLDENANQALPSSGGPNDLLAAYWDDLDPLTGGQVHYATLGTPPARRFIAQWTDVPHRGMDYPLHTFQVVLREGSDQIEYVYLDTPVVGGAISPTLGLENSAGTAGIALDAELLTPKGSRRFKPAPVVACAPPATVAYCTAGTTTNGCAASMASSGTPSVSQPSGFVVGCNDVEGQKQGILFYGVNGMAAQPWGLGSTSFLCVKAPYQRTGVSNSGGATNQCNGALSVDLLAYLASHPAALGMPFNAGQQCWAQAWFRDPPTSKTTSLSNGLAITFQP
jgi:hypothetical protein